MSPQPTKRNGKLSSAEQDSFKNVLRKRHKLCGSNPHACEICADVVGDLESAHIIDHALYLRADGDFGKIAGVPISLNDAVNGLLLCSNCHTKFDKIVSKKEGRSIRLFGISLKMERFAFLVYLKK